MSLVEHAPIVTPRARLHGIVKEVADKHGVALHQIMTDCRYRHVCAARWECFYRFRAQGMSLPAIGRFFGGKDHTTVLNGLRRYQAAFPEASDG